MTGRGSVSPRLVKLAICVSSQPSGKLGLPAAIREGVMLPCLPACF